VLVHHFLNRRVMGALPLILAPRGVVAFCQPTRRTLERTPDFPEAYLLEPGEGRRLLDGLDILYVMEGWTAENLHEARVVGRLPSF
jgi:hypothetical protein